jgi:ParB-like chromosome segregation protein Spo0J
MLDPPTAVAAEAGDEPERATAVAAKAKDEPERATAVAAKAGDEPKPPTAVVAEARDEPKRANAVAAEARDEPERATTVAAERDELDVSPRRRDCSRLKLVPIDRIDENAAFRIRPTGDLSALATDLARLGQVFPVEVRAQPDDRYQLVCGFRRVAALKFLQRDAVWARVHANLSDEDALLMALAAGVHSAPASREELSSLRARLEAEGRLSVAVRDMLEKALATESSLAPESVEDEVDANELAEAVTLKLSETNEDLSLLADVYDSLDEEHREELMRQLRYSADLVAYLEGR